MSFTVRCQEGAEVLAGLGVQPQLVDLTTAQPVFSGEHPEKQHLSANWRKKFFHQACGPKRSVKLCRLAFTRNPQRLTEAWPSVQRHASRQDTRTPKSMVTCDLLTLGKERLEREKPVGQQREGHG